MIAARTRWALVIAGFAFVLLWDQAWLAPLRLFVVLLHESGHALATVLTGGEVLALTVGLDESGAVLSRGGWELLILNSGYLGSLLWGRALLALAFRAPKPTTIGLGVFFLAAALLWARPLVSFGFVWTAICGAALLTLGRWASARVLTPVLASLGVFSLLYALGDVVSDVLLRPGAPSDARFLAERTGVPTLVWGLGWTVISLWVLWAALGISGRASGSHAR